MSAARGDPHGEKDKGCDGVNRATGNPHDEPSKLLVLERCEAQRRRRIARVPKPRRKREEPAEQRHGHHRGKEMRGTHSELALRQIQYCPPEQERRHQKRRGLMAGFLLEGSCRFFFVGKHATLMGLGCSGGTILIVCLTGNQKGGS